MRVFQRGLVVVLLAGSLSACGALIVSGQTRGGQSASAEPAEARRDATITAAINRQFVRDAQISAFDVRVDTRDGMVRLHGHVRDSKAEQRAVELARSTKGVRGVESFLTTIPR